MQLKEELDSTNSLITVRFSGHSSKEDLMEAIRNTRLKSIELNYKILFDFRGFVADVSIADAYYFIPDSYGKDSKIMRIPAAYIYDEENKDILSFTVSVNLD